MDILDWINKEIKSAKTIYDSGVSEKMKLTSRMQIVTLKKVARRLRKEYGWQPGPPPADPENLSQWELDWGEGEKYLCEVSKFDAGRMIWESNAELPPDDNDLSRVVRHRRIMPAPGEQS